MNRVESCVLARAHALERLRGGNYDLQFLLCQIPGRRSTPGAPGKPLGGTATQYNVALSVIQDGGATVPVTVLKGSASGTRSVHQRLCRLGAPQAGTLSAGRQARRQRSRPIRRRFSSFACDRLEVRSPTNVTPSTPGVRILARSGITPIRPWAITQPVPSAGSPRISRSRRGATRHLARLVIRLPAQSGQRRR